MTISSEKITLPFVLPILLVARLVAAGDTASAGYSVGDEVPLDESDLQEITLQVLEKNPLLSSSPGIKVATAQRSVRSIDHAEVIYYPHAENAGIREAFQVICWRQRSDNPWTCDDAEIRRYMQLDSQTFEVRVKGEIGFRVALALIRATRDTLRASVTDGSEVPQTAILIFPYDESYLVTWGSAEGYQELTMQARFSKDGDPTNPKDWQANIYAPEH